MPKKKVKKRKKKIITKRKTKVKSLALKQEKELIYRTKKDWISKALVNKSQYEKKYKSFSVGFFYTSYSIKIGCF